MNRTDTLRVEFPFGVDSAEDAKAHLQSFGDIQEFEMLKDLSAAIVSYYDIRSCETAAAYFGDRAKQEKMRGHRTVWLSGDAKLDLSNVDAVSALSPDPDVMGCFIVEFFDTRAAAKASDMGGEATVTKKLAVVTQKDAAESKSLSYGPPPGLGPSSRAAKPTARLHSSAPTKLILRGIPNSICANKLCVDAMLEQAGLTMHVDKMEFQQGNLCGEVRLSLWGAEAVQKCFSHFQGMRWDPQMPVTVMEVPSKTWEFLNSAEPARIPLPKPSVGEPARVPLPQPLRSSLRLHASKLPKSGSNASFKTETEASTEAGLSEEELIVEGKSDLLLH